MRITLRNPLDMHLHLRDEEMLKAVAPYSAKGFCGGIVMPNLTPPISSALQAKAYKKRIQEIVPNFYPICAIYLTDEMNEQSLKECLDAGFRILKLYPKGSTTGSQSGITNIIDKKILDLFEIAQDLGMILSIHGESNGFVMEREYEFGEIFKNLASTFPNLKIIIEHMSDARTITLLERFPNLYATLTLHHITMSLDDVLGGKLNPHHFCKPILKTKSDQKALLNLALNAHPKISFGSDSAPHTLDSKLNGAAGIFSAPCLLEMLTELFDKYNALENLQAFISDNAMRIYDLDKWLSLPQKEVILEKKPCAIPKSIKFSQGEIIPLYAGKSPEWSIVES